MKVRLVFLLAALTLPLAVLRADSQADEWISKARASLGSERALNAVNSIHFVGLLDTMQETVHKHRPKAIVALNGGPEFLPDEIQQRVSFLYAEPLDSPTAA